MVELVDTKGLNPLAEKRASSSLATRTNLKEKLLDVFSKFAPVAESRYTQWT